MGNMRGMWPLEERFAGNRGVGVSRVVLLDYSVQVAVDSAGVEIELVGDLLNRETLISELQKVFQHLKSAFALTW